MKVSRFFGKGITAESRRNKSELTMNGRYVTYDQIDLFDGFQQGNRGNNTTTTKNQQQRTSPFPFMNGNQRGNGAGPCGDDYDPTALLAGTGSPYNSTAAALGNAGAQLIAAGAAASRGVSNTIPGYGLYRPAGAPNPALIQNLQHQAAFHHHQQQQQHQQHHRQRQHHQQAVEAALIADYEPVGLQQTLRQPGVSARHQRPNDSILHVPANLFASEAFDAPGVVASSLTNQATKSKAPAPPPAWLKDLKIDVSGLSLEPLPGAEVVDRIEKKTRDVLKRYLPCVDFLVACQQDLRKGLIMATQKRMIRRAYRDSMTPRQFHQKYIAPLADRFLMSNQRIMEANHLTEAYNEVKKLATQAGAVERQGSEVMKNTFLGGMKDGESWGLRKWLSKHGGALQICTDLELILSACQKLNKELESTKKLAALMRPMAKRSLDRLKADVPQSYQEISTAHPYLPFFHRLEAALRSLSNFDPEDDDVICLDDSDDDDDVVVHVKKKTPVKTSANLKPAARKRPPNGCNSAEKSLKRPRIEMAARKVEPVARHASRPNDGDDSDSDIEIVGVVKPAGKTSGEDDDDKDENDVGGSQDLGWNCSGCTTQNSSGSSVCNGCKMSKDFVNDLMQFPAFEDVMNVKTGLSDSEDNSVGPGGFDFGGVSGSSSRGHSPVPGRKATPTPNSALGDPLKLSRDVDALADVFEIERQASIRPRNSPVQPDSFWEGAQYGKALRLLSQILRMDEAVSFINPVDDSCLYPPYGTVIKNPLCFTDIVYALIPENFNNLEFDSGRSGLLRAEGLKFWNMWCGQDLLQAIDLVFLNALAYGKMSDGGPTGQRTEINRLRKVLWNGIQEIIALKVGTSKELQKQHAPTRRGETSGFVIFKSRNR